MTATLPVSPPRQTNPQKRSQPTTGLIIKPDSLWFTSTDPHIERNAPALLRLIQVIETDPLSSGLVADHASVKRLRCAFEVIAETYVNPFHTICHKFYTAPDGNQNSVQNRILRTLCGLSEKHPEVPGILWHVLGHIGTRLDPYAELSLLDDEHYAFGSAALNDAALHAMCMVTRLKSLIDDHLIESVSAVIVHAHKCDCCIEAVTRYADFEIRQRSKDELVRMFDAFMSQLFSEVIKTCGYNLPHAAS